MNYSIGGTGVVIITKSGRPRKLEVDEKNCINCLQYFQSISFTKTIYGSTQGFVYSLQTKETIPKFSSAIFSISKFYLRIYFVKMELLFLYSVEKATIFSDKMNYSLYTIVTEVT